MQPLAPAELSGVWAVCVCAAGDGRLETELAEYEAAGVDGVVVAARCADDAGWLATQRTAARLCTELELPWRVAAVAPDLDARVRHAAAAARLEPAAIDVGALAPGTEKALAGACGDVGLIVDLSPDGLSPDVGWLHAHGVVGLRAPALDEDTLEPLRSSAERGELALGAPAVEVASAWRMGATFVEGALVGLAPAACVAWWDTLEDDLPRGLALERRVLRWLEGALRPAARRAGLEDPLAPEACAAMRALLSAHSRDEVPRDAARQLGLGSWLHGT